MAKGIATGKLILLGEHFVVKHEAADGRVLPATPALAFPLRDLRCEVRLSPNSHPRCSVDVPQLEDRETVESLMSRAAYAAGDAFRIDMGAQPLRIESRANFPISRGFGSSAAFAVALARAFDDYRHELIGERATWDELERASMAVEKIFHGRPSGVDAAVILAQRPIRFENGAVARELNNKAVDLIAVDSGVRENSKPLIQRVGEFRAKNPEQWSKMAERVGSLVDGCERALVAADADGVAAAVREAHGILAELGLSNPGIEGILEQSRKLGALDGKVSGAGGGGAVVVVARKGMGLQVADGLKQLGIGVLAIELAGAGEK